MTFLNIVLLGGMAAFLVPLILHLLNRSRHKVVRWGAMHLLESALKVNQRRLRFEQLLLLLLRCAIPLLLALALARPVITGWRALLGDAPASLVVLLDDSYSMQAGGATRTAFQDAIEEAGRVLSDLRGGSEASVLTFGGRVAPVNAAATLEVRALADELQLVRADGGPVKVVDAFSASAERLAKAAHGRRGLVIVSDFQKADWGAKSEGGADRLAQQARSLPGSPPITLFRVGSGSAENVCVESLALPTAALGVGQPAVVRATLRNYGATAHQGLRVYFRTDGRQQAATQVSLGPEATVEVEFTCRFEEPGSHRVEVEADAADLKADNVHAGALEVLDRLCVLLVDGDLQPRRLRGESGFLRTALEPVTADRGERGDLVEVETVSDRDFQEGSLAGKRVVILANVAQLAGEPLRALETFVSEGGGLIVFPGDRVLPDWYNQELLMEGTGLMPMKMGAIAGSLTDRQEQTRPAGERYEHPVLQLFNDPQNGDLTRAVVRSWFRLQPVAGSGESVSVLARLENGDPFLVQRRYGDGVVILAATACDADWSNLPMRPFYVPLAQQLVSFAAANTMPPRNVMAGQPLLAHLPIESAAQKLVLLDPDGRTHELKATGRGGQAVFEFSDTQRPGLYTLTDSAGRAIHFVVSADRSESRLEVLGEEELRQLARRLGGTLVGSGDEYARVERGRRFGREVWRGLLVAVLAIAFLEQWLAQRFARAKTATEPLGLVRGQG